MSSNGGYTGGQMLHACYCCDGVLSDWATKENTYGHFSLSRCRDCGSAFVNPRPTFQEIADFYSTNRREPAHRTPNELLEAEKQYPNGSLDAKRIIRVISRIHGDHRGTARFLDVGAGFGFSALEAQKADFVVTCLEVGDFERQCIRVLTGLDAAPIFFEDYIAEPASFDAILFSQLLEHVIDPVEFVGRARRLLKPGGVLAIAVPNFNSIFRMVMGVREPHIIPPEHLNFFTAPGLTMLLRKSGFRVVGSPEYVTRLPFASRAPRVVGNLLSPLQEAFCAALKGLRLGTYLNVYAQAPSGNVTKYTGLSMPSADSVA